MMHSKSDPVRLAQVVSGQMHGPGQGVSLRKGYHKGCKLWPLVIEASLVQVVGGQMYVVGEVAPWQSRHEFIKHQLLELARADKQLPDVDMYFASEDIPEWTDMSEMPPRCR